MEMRCWSPTATEWFGYGKPSDSRWAIMLVAFGDQGVFAYSRGSIRRRQLAKSNRTRIRPQSWPKENYGLRPGVLFSRFEFLYRGLEVFVIAKFKDHIPVQPIEDINIASGIHADHGGKPRSRRQLCLLIDEVRLRFRQCRCSIGLWILRRRPTDESHEHAIPSVDPQGAV